MSYQDQNVSGWLMSEKLDGVRALWDGKTLKTKQGKNINAPTWFIANLPAFALDGELWSKRDDFSFIQSTVMSQNPDKRWRKITYNIFDCPSQSSGILTRLKPLRAYLAQHKIAHVKIIAQHKCKDTAHLMEFFKRITAGGGEGVVVRDADAPYINAASDKILKLKKFTQSQCKVIRHFKGKGKFAKMLGSLECESSNGVRFKIGSGFSDAQRLNPPKIGAIVRFRFSGLTKNSKPRFPVFLQVKEDK